MIVGRRLPPRAQRIGWVRYRRVRERNVNDFRSSYAASTTRVVAQATFKEDSELGLKLPELGELWEYLSNNRRIAALADFGLGLVYHSEDLPPDVPTYSEDRFAGAKRGFVRFGSGLGLHQLPRLYWMNLADEAILRRRAGTTVGTPQVLLN